jgi:hypothetical protein
MADGAPMRRSGSGARQSSDKGQYGLAQRRSVKQHGGQPDVVQPRRGITVGDKPPQQYVENVMTPNEIARVQDYLRRTFGNDRITIVPPPKRGAPIEMLIGDEFIGVVHRDEDEGEVSYDLHITILSEDLPPASAVPAGTKGKPTR